MYSTLRVLSSHLELWRDSTIESEELKDLVGYNEAPGEVQERRFDWMTSGLIGVIQVDKSS